MLQQNLSKHHNFESADVVCDQFNKFMNMLMKEEEESKEKIFLSGQER